MSAAETPDYERQLVERMLSFRHDPLGAVLFGFPWGKGELADYSGPRKWQCEELERLGQHLRNPDTRWTVYRRAISSGHGIGKTTLAAFIAWWAQSTCLDAMVRCTANTYDQLKSTTSPEFARWFRIAINAHWFDVNVSSIRAKDPQYGTSWRLDFMPWSEENTQAFAGKHNAGRRMSFILEEASDIPGDLYRVINGALMDANAERIFFTIGNPTRDSGPFYDSVWGKTRNRWSSRIVDSREVENCDLEEIKGWLDECDNDEESDYFRVRARGLYPKSGQSQFIDRERIHAAQKRTVSVLPDEPLVAGVDFAWGGSDDNVVRFRRGLDAKSIAPIKIKGEFTRDPAVMTHKLGEVLQNTYDGRKVAMMFMDSAGIAGPVAARLRALGHRNIMEVNFGGFSPDDKCAFLRDYMWNEMRDWLLRGAIDKDPGLEADLVGPITVSDAKQRIKLESKDVMKKRLKKMGRSGDSPDDGDALALTFAHPVRPKEPEPIPEPYIYHEGQQSTGWMA